MSDTMMTFHLNTMTKLSTGLLLTILVLTSVMFYLHYDRPTGKFYAVPSGSSKVIRMRPLSSASLSTKSLLNWATQAATACYTTNFNSISQDLEAVREYFTFEGYQKFLEALESSNLPTAIVNDKLIMASVVNDPPVVLRESVVNGRRTWRVVVPMLLTFQAANTDKKQQWYANLLITDVPSTEAIKGIGIAQFTMRRGPASA